MKIYVVKMNRWGDPEGHSYVLGAFSNMILAVEAGNAEEEYRGGKYESYISELDLDKTYTTKHIRISR